MHRKPLDWKLKPGTIHLGEHTLLLGVLDLAPKSRLIDPDLAFAHAIELTESGASMIMLDAASLTSGEEQEIHRVIAVIKRLNGKIDVPVGVVTTRSAVAERAFGHGAQIVHDPSGLTYDQNLGRVVAQADGAIILGHLRGTPETWAKLGSMKAPVSSVFEELAAGLSRAVRSGIPRHRIAIDPGLGMGKRKEQNAELLAGLHRFISLEVPVHVRLFLPDWPEAAKSAAAVAAVLQGAHMISDTDIAALRISTDVADQVQSAVEQPETAVVQKPAPRGRRPAQRQYQEEKPASLQFPVPGRSVTPPPTEAPPFEPEIDQPEQQPVVEEVKAAAEESEHLPPPPPDREAPPIKESKPVPARYGSKAPADRPYRKPSGDRPPYRKAEGDRPRYGKPEGDRPPSRYGKPAGERVPYRKPEGDRPRSGKPEGDRPRYGKPEGDRPRYSKPEGERPSYRKPEGDRPRYGRPAGDRPPYRKPEGDRPRYSKPAGDRPPSRKPEGDRPRYGKPEGERPRYGKPDGDRPRYGRPAGDRPQGDRPPGDKPFKGKSGGPGFGGARKPFGSPRDRDDRPPRGGSGGTGGGKGPAGGPPKGPRFPRRKS